MLSSESIWNEGQIEEISNKISDDGLVTFAMRADTNQLSQTHPLLSGILRSLIVVLKNQSKQLDRLSKSWSDTNIRTLSLSDALQDLKTQFVDFRAETQVDMCSHIKRRPAKKVSSETSSTTAEATLSPRLFPVAPSAPSIASAAPKAGDYAKASDPVTSILLSKLHPPAVAPTAREEGESSFRAMKSHRLERLPADVRAQQEQLNQDIDQLILDINQNFDTTNKNINRELDELNKAFYDAISAEAETREKQLTELKHGLEKDNLKQLDTYAEIIQEQNRKLEAALFNVDRMQADLFELRSVVYAQKSQKFKSSKDSVAPLIDLSSLTSDLANKVDKTELKNQIAVQESSIGSVAKDLKLLQERFDALNEIMAVGTGGKLFADALEVRFTNLMNELYRLEKLKIGREDVQELIQRRLNENPTCVSVKCLSCHQSVDVAREANKSHKLQEFPPSSLARTKPVAPMSPSIGNSNVEGTYYSETVAKIEGATEDSTPQGFSKPKFGRKMDASQLQQLQPATKAFMSHSIQTHGRHKLQDYHDWMKSHHKSPHGSSSAKMPAAAKEERLPQPVPTTAAPNEAAAMYTISSNLPPARPSTS